MINKFPSTRCGGLKIRILYTTCWLPKSLFKPGQIEQWTILPVLTISLLTFSRIECNKILKKLICGKICFCMFPISASAKWVIDGEKFDCLIFPLILEQTEQPTIVWFLSIALVIISWV